MNVFSGGGRFDGGAFSDRHEAWLNERRMAHDPAFDSTQNQALLVVCARKTIRNAAIIVCGDIDEAPTVRLRRSGDRAK